MKTYWLDKNELRKPLGNIMIQATQSNSNNSIPHQNENRTDSVNHRTDSAHSRGSDCRSVYSPVTFQDVDHVINSPNRRGIIHTVEVVDDP